MTATALAVSTEGLTKRFGELTAVDAINLHVEAGGSGRPRREVS